MIPGARFETLQESCHECDHGHTLMLELAIATHHDGQVGRVEVTGGRRDCEYCMQTDWGLCLAGWEVFHQLGIPTNVDRKVGTVRNTLQEAKRVMEEQRRNGDDEFGDG